MMNIVSINNALNISFEARKKRSAAKQRAQNVSLKENEGKSTYPFQVSENGYLKVYSKNSKEYSETINKINNKTTKKLNAALKSLNNDESIADILAQRDADLVLATIKFMEVKTKDNKFQRLI